MRRRKKPTLMPAARIGCSASKTSCAHCWSSAFTAPYDVCSCWRCPCERQENACSPFSSHPWTASPSTSFCGNQNHQVRKSAASTPENDNDPVCPSDSFCRDDALCCVKVTFPCWPSRFFGVVLCCALLLEDGPRRPRTHQTLRC